MSNVIVSGSVKLGLIQVLTECLRSKFPTPSEIQTGLLNFKSPILKSDQGDSVSKLNIMLNMANPKVISVILRVQKYSANLFFYDLTLTKI